MPCPWLRLGSPRFSQGPRGFENLGQPVAPSAEPMSRCPQSRAGHSVWTPSPTSSGSPRERRAIPWSQLFCPINKGGNGMPATQHSFLTAGGWLIPGTSALCPPATPHPQFGGPLSLPSTHGCERYPALRNHRPSPYPSPYAHRNSSPSKLHVEGDGVGGLGRPLLGRSQWGLGDRRGEPVQTHT